MIEKQAQKRIEWIDTAKGIGLLLVILGHLHVPLIATWIYTFHMPLFFFLSGVVFSGTKYNFKEFLKKRLQSLVIPYFSLGFVIWLFYVIINTVLGTKDSLYGTNFEMLKNLFVQEHFWTIWFLACLFLVEILYYILHKVCKGNLLISTMTSILICVIGFLRYHFGMESLPWNADVALVAQFFYHLGWLFKSEQQLKKQLTLAKGLKAWMIASVLFVGNLVAGLLCIKIAHESLDMSVGLYGNEVLTILSACAGILGVIVVANQLKCRFLTYLGRNTMIIFAWHSRIIIVLCQYVYEYFRILQGNDLISRLLYAIITFVVILGVLIPINEIIKRSRFHKIFGV